MKGLKNSGDNKYVYPYYAKSPVTGKRKHFKSLDDVNEELIMCYDELAENSLGGVGENLYLEHFFFCNTYELLNKDYQNTIKKYNFCKMFSALPYKSLEETPATVVDDFTMIETEYETFKIKEARKYKK